MISFELKFNDYEICMKNLNGYFSGTAIAKYGENSGTETFDFSVAVPDDENIDERTQSYYSLCETNYGEKENRKFRIYQIDPLGAFELGVEFMKSHGSYFEPNNPEIKNDIQTYVSCNGFLQGRGFYRDTTGISNNLVEFSVKLSNERIKNKDFAYQFYAIISLKSPEISLNEEYPIFAYCPIKAFLLGVSFVNSRISYLAA